MEKYQGVDNGGMKALEGYFDNLAATMFNEKLVLENLVANNTKLSATNENLVAMVKKLTNGINNLERETSCLKKGGKIRWDPTLCHHCKKEGYHEPDACQELVINKDKRPPDWIRML